MSTQKTKFLLFVQAGLNQTDLSFERVIYAMVEASFVPDVEMPDSDCEIGQMVIEFVNWQIDRENAPSWYKEEWIDPNW